MGRLHERMARVVPGIALERIGAPGATVSELLGALIVRALEPAPSVVAVAAGASDLFRATPLDRFRADVGLLIAMAANISPVVVVYLLPDIALLPGYRRTRRARAIRERVAELNAILRAAAERHGAAVADLELWSIAAYDDAAFFSPDGRHPSDEGHAVWAQLTWPVFERLPIMAGASR